MDPRFYERRVCKGLCVQLDTMGLCMGLCTTEPSYVQRVYDHAKKNADTIGEPFTVIPYYAEQTWRRDAALAWLGRASLSIKEGQPVVHYIYSTISTNTLTQPTWCTTHPDDAHLFEVDGVDGRVCGPHLMPVYAKYINPLIVEVPFDMVLSPQVLSDILKLPEPLFENKGGELRHVLRKPSLVEALKKNGFDAVQVVAKHGSALLGLSPLQFKSALGNSGRFNPDSVTLTDFEKAPPRKPFLKKTPQVVTNSFPTRKLG